MAFNTYVRQSIIKEGELNMKLKSSLILQIMIPYFLFLACSEPTTSLQGKTEFITRVWNGEEFFLITLDDSTFRGKDFVETFEFKNDGTYFLYKYSMSSMGRIGQWKFEDDGNRIKLTPDGANSEDFPILELNTESFIFGDTTLHGYKLIAK
jgi:hypothetical protein